MRNMSEPELTQRIRAFIDKKSAKYPELAREPRFITRSVIKHTHIDSFQRLHPAM